jgi:hypothetical protein
MQEERLDHVRKLPVQVPHWVRGRYFDWHHTEVDTLDKVNPDNFRRAMGLLAVMGSSWRTSPGPSPRWQPNDGRND